MSIMSLLQDPKQQATVEVPLFTPFVKGDDSISTSSSSSTWADSFPSAAFEILDNQTVTSLSMDFNESPKFSDETPSANFEVDWDLARIDDEVFEPFFQEYFYSTLRDGFEDTTRQRSDPTPDLFDFRHRSSAITHKKSVRGEQRYPCPINLCSRNEGENGFGRKDHLIQHLRTFHSLSQEDLVPGFCPHNDCFCAKGPRNKKRVLSTCREYSRHLKNSHEESLFNCPIPDCRRKGANGYSGRANWLRHVKRRHPQMIDKVVADQDYLFGYLANAQ
jgi:hypothetical protein